MTQLTRMIAVAMLMGAISTTGCAQSRPSLHDQVKMSDEMKMIGDHMNFMNDQMKSGKMTPEQMRMMGDHMQMMADSLKSGPMMTADQTKAMDEHMKMLREHMTGKN
jgi:hypothetical protein